MTAVLNLPVTRSDNRERPFVFLEKVARATVSIHSQVPQDHPSVAIGLGDDRRGTGTIVSADGLIVTVNYVIMGAQNVIVTLVNGEQFPARVVARDFTTSLGLLQIEGRDYPTVEVVSSAKLRYSARRFSSFRV